MTSRDARHGLCHAVNGGFNIFYTYFLFFISISEYGDDDDDDEDDDVCVRVYACVRGRVGECACVGQLREMIDREEGGRASQQVTHTHTHTHTRAHSSDHWSTGQCFDHWSML